MSTRKLQNTVKRQSLVKVCLEHIGHLDFYSVYIKDSAKELRETISVQIILQIHDLNIRLSNGIANPKLRVVVLRYVYFVIRW